MLIDEDRVVCPVAAGSVARRCFAQAMPLCTWRLPAQSCCTPVLVRSPMSLHPPPQENGLVPIVEPEVTLGPGELPQGLAGGLPAGCGITNSGRSQRPCREHSKHAVPSWRIHNRHIAYVLTQLRSAEAPGLPLSPGDYSIETTAYWSERVYSHVFRLLNEYHVQLDCILLKPNMVLPGGVLSF